MTKYAVVPFNQSQAMPKPRLTWFTHVLMSSFPVSPCISSVNGDTCVLRTRQTFPSFGTGYMLNCSERLSQFYAGVVCWKNIEQAEDHQYVKDSQ